MRHRYFYPRPPRGGRRRKITGWQAHSLFLSTPSARRATRGAAYALRRHQVFLSTPSARRATERALNNHADNQFLSTPSARRATGSGLSPDPSEVISIHALREEGDAVDFGGGKVECDFYPRPPRGGRQAVSIANSNLIVISIHALREEGDRTILQRHGHEKPISIHALREEGDPPDDGLHRGGRISIHALREEGDPFRFAFDERTLRFLSTPSARRATAKTETKSLFSYKLYNILHEFRRALIYNGSKNYPNHAK